MLQRGYAAVSMAEVAERAGVAVQTLYALAPGGKAALAKLAWDVALAGDARPVALSDRPEVVAIVAERDPIRKLELYAAMATAIHVRTAPLFGVLRSAAAAQPSSEAAEVLATTEHERLIGSLGPAEHLESVGALRAGLPAERASHQIYALTSPELFQQLTQTCGWRVNEYEAWLAHQLRATLLQP
jgi:AcrR family transcriptional regulator